MSKHSIVKVALCYAKTVLAYASPAFAAMMEMGKVDIAAIEAARRG